MKKAFLFIIPLFWLSACRLPAQSGEFSWYSGVRDSMITIPAPAGYVNDYESIFLPAEKDSLEKLITTHYAKTGNEIVVVTIDSLFGSAEELKAFANALGNKWGIGQKGKDNGVILVFGKRLRKIWIAPGKGLEAVLTNEQLQTVINDVIIPSFKKEDYFEGTKNGLDAVCRLLE